MPAARMPRPPPRAGADEVLDQAFNSAIAQYGTDLVNPLADAPAGEEGSDQPMGGFDTPIGEQSVPWSDGQEAPAPAARITPTPPARPQARIPAGERPVPGATSQPVTRLNLAQLPPDVRGYADQLQADYDLRVAALNDRAKTLESVSQFSDVAQHLAQSPALREHVRQWYIAQQGGQVPASSGPVDPADELLSTLHPEEQKIIQAIETRFERKYQAQLKKAIEPYENDRNVVQAMREEQEFVRDFPEWQEFVSPDVLMKAKELRPNEHLSTLFSSLAMRTAMQKLRGGGLQNPPARNPQQPPAQPPQRQPVNPALRLMELSRREMPPSLPRQQPAPVERQITKGPHAMDEAFDTVIERLSRG